MSSPRPASRKTATREYSRRAAAPQSAAPRDISPPIFSTYDSRFGQIAFALLWLMLLLAPYAFSGFAPATQDDFAPPAPFGPLTGQSLFCAMTALTAFFVALVPRAHREYSRAERLTVFALAAFFALLCASVFVASYRYDALLETVRVGCVVTWFFLARAILLTPCDDETPREYSHLGENFAPRVLATRLGALLVAIALGGALVSALAIRDFLANGGGRQASTFYNNNLLANSCAMAAPFSLAFAIYALRRSRQSAQSPLSLAMIGAAGLSFFITLGGLFATASKGGFLAMLVALLVFCGALFFARRAALTRFIRARRVLVACVAAAVLLGGGAVASKTVVPRLLAARTTDDNSTMFRAYTWRGTLKMAQAKPLLGWGAGAFPATYSTRFGETGYTRSAHQSWLQIAAECGFPALLALLVSFGAACVCGARGLRGAAWETSAGALAALAALLTHGFVDSGWNITSIALLAMAAMAMLLCSQAASTRTSQNAADEAPHDRNEAHRADVSPRAGIVAIAESHASTRAATTREASATPHVAPRKNGAIDAARHPEKLRSAASTREAPSASGGNIQWSFMAGALAVAGAAWWMQSVVSANDLIARNENSAGGLTGELQRSADAIAQNGGNATLHLYRAKRLEASGQNALSSYQAAAALRPNSGEGWRALAEYLARRGQSEMPEELFARAAQLDPKNTALLLDYAKFRLAHGDARGYDNLRQIVALREKPYGRYPALGDFVNLDFARAALLLAPRETDPQRRTALLKMAQRDLKTAREKQAFVTKLAASNYGAAALEAPQDLDELENQARVLASKTGAR